MGFICHLANGSQGRIHRQGRALYPLHSNHDFVVVRVAQWLARLALCCVLGECVTGRPGLSGLLESEGLIGVIRIRGPIL